MNARFCGAILTICKCLPAFRAVFVEIWGLRFGCEGALLDYPSGGARRIVELRLEGCRLEQVSNESLILAQNQRWRRA